jgi:hypothetical protein
VYSPVYRLKSFETIDDAAKFRVMDRLLEALIASNVEYLRAAPRTPLLYESGVYYEAEPDGRDEWQDIPDTLARGNGDCEDLACWRVAELRERYGRRDVTCGLTKSDMPLQSGAALVTMFHIVVVYYRLGRCAPGRPGVGGLICRPNQIEAVEDPSRHLGMQ